MRDVPFEPSTATTLARAFILTLSGGERYGFTDCDVSLTVDGVQCKPMQAADSEGRSGFDADSGAMRTVFDVDLSENAILAGAVDGATLEAWRVDWSDTSKAMRLHKGRIAGVTTGPNGFEADWLGMSSLLNRSTGRVFARRCDAEYGDSRCGLIDDGQGCARTLDACRAHNNAVNFRGFPFILGDDALQAGVHQTPTRDGGSRYA